MKLRALGRYLSMGGNSDYEYERIYWNPLEEKPPRPDIKDIELLTNMIGARAVYTPIEKIAYIKKSKKVKRSKEYSNEVSKEIKEIFGID